LLRFDRERDSLPRTFPVNGGLRTIRDWVVERLRTAFGANTEQAYHLIDIAIARIGDPARNYREF
jgi:hypothetical protein